MSEATSDGIIEFLSEIARNSERGGTSITLLVHGVVVTGAIIGREEYYSRVGDLWASQMPAPHREKTEQFWRRLGEDPASSPGEGNAELGPEAFIHLENAQLVTPDGFIPPGGLLWRGQICRVDGFFFGKLKGP